MGFITRSLKERRDSLSNPSKWLIMAFGGGTDTATGIRVNEIVALRNLTIMACVNVISESVAQLPFPVYRRTSDGGKERVPDHPLYRLLDKQPNDRMTSFTMRQTLVAHLLTWGNAYAYIDRDRGGRPIALYPLLPDRTRPQLNADGGLVYLTRIKYDPNGTSPSDNKQIVLDPEDVLHVPGLGFDGLKGYSVISQARESIGLGLALEEYAARFFGNGATPGLILTAPRNLSPEQRTLFETRWQEGHQGLTNAQRPAILEGDWKIEKVGIPPEDAQFLESRKFSRNELASIYRVPPHMIGDIERATSWGTGIEQQAIGFVVYTLMPWLTRIEQAVNIKLFSPTEQRSLFAEFVVDGLLRGDTQTRYAAYNLAFGKWMDADDIRARENLPKWGPGKGDQAFIPSGMTPLASAPEEAPVALPAPPEETQPTTASRPAFDLRTIRDGVVAAHRIALTDVFERVLRRERADVGREAARGKLTDAFLEDFYREHAGYVERQAGAAIRALIASLEVIGGGASEEDIDAYIKDLGHRHAAASMDMLLADASPVGLEAAFGPSGRRAERIADVEAERLATAFGPQEANGPQEAGEVNNKQVADLIAAMGRSSQRMAEAVADLAKASRETPIVMNVTNPEVRIPPQPAPIVNVNPTIPVQVDVKMPDPVGMDIVYDKQGRVIGNRPVRD